MASQDSLIVEHDGLKQNLVTVSYDTKVKALFCLSVILARRKLAQKNDHQISMDKELSNQ